MHRSLDASRAGLSEEFCGLVGFLLLELKNK
jgi:hypothetical protein